MTMQRQENDGHYRTTDLYYAAYLKVAAVPFVDAVQEGGRTIFLFEQVEGMRELRQGYFTRTTKVSALSYADEIKAMKSLTHSD